MVTPTEKARRAEALYYDNNNITRRTLCHMIANLESDLKDARTRNAKLLEYITSQKQTIQAYRDESREWCEVAERAQAENAKLREELESVGTAATCQNVAPWYLDFLCSECGFVHYHSDENDTDDGNEWHFCPNCGQKVEQRR